MVLGQIVLTNVVPNGYVVTGPTSAVDSGNAKFDGTSGAIIKDGGAGNNFPYVAKTALYTVTASDYVVECTSGTFTITLPTAVSISGRTYKIKNSGTGLITVDGNGSETIDGGTTVTLYQYDCLTITSNGANWIIT